MSEDTINIEALMQQIQDEIAARGAQLPADERADEWPDGTRFPPDFYEHLRQAHQLHNQIQPPILLTDTHIPLVGSLVQSVRRKLHELVIFYVQEVAARQVQVNAHILQALIILSQELERDTEEQA